MPRRNYDDNNNWCGSVVDGALMLIMSTYLTLCKGSANVLILACFSGRTHPQPVTRLSAKCAQRTLAVCGLRRKEKRILAWGMECALFQAVASYYDSQGRHMHGACRARKYAKKMGGRETHISSPCYDILQDFDFSLIYSSFRCNTPRQQTLWQFVNQKWRRRLMFQKNWRIL